MPLASNGEACGGATFYLGSYFSRRPPMAKLVAALLSFLVHILSAYCQWQSCRRRCCLFWFIFCPQIANGEAGGAAVCFGSYFARRLPMVKLAALLSVLVHILPADCQWRSWWRRCCLFYFVVTRIIIFPSDC
jgi:hypothetical protein